MLFRLARAGLMLLALTSAAAAQTYSPDTVRSDAATIFRDFNTNGVSGSGVFQPRKDQIRSLLGDIGDWMANDQLRVADACNATTGSPTDGSTDNTACIQAAVNTLCSRPSVAGGTLFFGPGTFQINAASGINIPCGGVDILGAGRGDVGTASKGTLLKIIGSGSTAIFNFAASLDPGDAYVAGGKVQNLTMWDSGNTSNAAVGQTGPMVFFAHNRGGLVRDVRIVDPYIGVWSFAGIDNGLDHVDINQLLTGGVAIYANGDEGSGDRQDIFSISHVEVDAAVQAGYASGICAQFKDFIQTVRIDYLTCNQVGIGLNINCPTSVTIGDCPAFFNIFDLETEPNPILNEGAGIAAFDFSQFYCAFCQVYGGSAQTTDTVSNGRVVNGVKMGNSRLIGTGDIQFVGGFVSDVNNSCVLFNGANFSWTDGRFKNCNRSGGTGNSLGYAFDIRAASMGGANASGSIKITNNNLGYFNGASTQPMGSVVLESGVDYAVVTGNILRGSAAINDISGGTHNVISDNAGP